MFDYIKQYTIGKYEPEKCRIFFTSDMHFSHRNIIEFCKRPFSSIDEMDEALIKNWNSVVREDDLVFNLGDFSFASNTRTQEIIDELNGRHVLILGNHDMLRPYNKAIYSKFEFVTQQMQLQIEGRYVYLNHYPFLCYGGSYRADYHSVWQLFGHVHSSDKSGGLDTKRLVNLFPYQYDVGVDNNNFTPISWEEAKEKIQQQVEDGIKISEVTTIPDDAYKE
jgi:calcineurin-like phosphoesterase family protein